MPPAPRANVDRWLFAGICAFAFALAYTAAGRGFFPMDQSIVFDGAYRVASGQVPYRDFVLPFGPAVFWLQALLFEVFGVGVFAYRLGGALANALGAACAMAIVRALFAQPRWLAWLAGGITAAWFCAPFGTLWMEQTAFLFGFFALALLIARLSLPSPPARGGGLALAASGACAFAALLGKQNAGGYLLPLFPVLIALRFAPSLRAIVREGLWWGAGFAGAAAVFALWLFGVSDPAAFQHHVFAIPAQTGAERLGRDVRGLLLTLLTGAGPDFLRLPLLATSGLALAVLLRPRWFAATARPRLVAAALCVGLALAQDLFVSTTFNAYENGLPFAGVVFALGAGLLLATPRAARLAPLITVCAFAAAGYIVWRGARLSLERQVHDVFAGASFPRELAIERLAGLRWASPTPLREFGDPPERGRDVRAEELESLVALLAERDANFFVFPDFTFLYGVLGRPSPQPLLFFHRGVSYATDYEPSLDRNIVEGLRANDVAIVVLERVSWFGTQSRLDDFPLLAAFLAQDFRKTREIGIFEIYERVGAAREAAGGPAS